ncbi:MAG: alpha/beta fold hydrolase [Bryobacterales bacterium]|nr:alpha/beta fold hydrolase [Bryobacterales bacterium]
MIDLRRILQRVVSRCAAAAAVLVASLAGAEIAEPVARIVDVGGYKLHFQIIPGQGIPILFEAGGGDDATVWKDLLKPVAAATGSTVIAYDRAGFGQSGIDPRRYGILSEIEGLETGLAKLGYSGELMIVAHSLGGFYATLYAARHPKQVRMAVLLDANHSCFFTEEQLGKMQDSEAQLARYKEQGLGRYHSALRFRSNAEVIRHTAFPPAIPVVDIVAGQTLFEGTPDAERWRACHREFVAASTARQGITAHGSGHYVFIGSRPMVTAAIVGAYAEIAGEAVRASVWQRAVRASVEALNEQKRQEAQYRHSESALNEWGYALLKKNDKENALAVFKLNASLHPGSANVHDSLAECYELTGDRTRAVAAYRRALEIDPQSKHALERLKSIAPAASQ